MKVTLYPTVKLLDEQAGILEYIASDQTIDHTREVVKADGWLFDYMEKNGPFVDSHRTGTIDNLVGKVLGARVENNQLIETVQWAIDVEANRLAQLGFAMTKAGYLKGVSVGFKPVMLTTRLAPDDWPSDDWCNAKVAYAGTRTGKAVWDAQVKALGLGPDAPVDTIYIQQQQLELSACIVPCNPNAVAKSFFQAYKAGVMTDGDLEMISKKMAESATADATDDPAHVAKARARARLAILMGQRNNTRS